MKKIAVIGTGRMGIVHAENIAKHKNAELSYVFDVVKDSVQKAASELGTQIAGSLDEIWNSDVDAVLIASSTNTHADLICDAIDANKAIYCEKPIDLNIERANEVLEKAKRFSLPIFLGFNRRFDLNHQGVKDALTNGTIGALEQVHIIERDPAPPPIEYVKVSGGQFRDQVIHFFDLLSWLTEDIPVEVYANGACLVNPEIAKLGDTDSSMVFIKMSKGTQCCLTNSRRSSYGYDERIEIFGSQAMAQSMMRPMREIATYSGTDVTMDAPNQDWFKRMELSYEIALDTFMRVLEGENLSYPKLRDGYNAQVLAEATLQSIKENKPTIIEGWIK